MDRNDDMTQEIATLAGGCFWCTEAVYQNLKGVSSVESGYIGGAPAYPTYEQVCSGSTGHAEAIRISFDPSVISYADLLDIFFATHNPTTLNRQGNDVGTQYRSAIFPHSPQQAERTGAGRPDRPDRHHDRRGWTLVSGGGLSPEILGAGRREQSLLRGGDPAQARQIAQGLCRAHRRLIGPRRFIALCFVLGLALLSATPYRR
jgi:methionine-S-sulfoxide reductase